MSTVKNTLKKYEIRPLKRLGQNFLVDYRIIRKVILAADLHKTDIVLEIGPGTGILTKELAKRTRNVVAVEKDLRMLDILKEELKGFSNVNIIHGDILKLRLIPYTLKPYKVVANLPFYLTAHVIRKFLELAEARPLLILIVQKEVAQRIVAKPPCMNLLAVSVQFYAQPKIISYIPKTSFWPQPKVDSAIIKITPSELLISEINRLFFRVVRAGFSQPRKQLVNNLSKKLQLDKEKASLWLLKNKVRPEQRAETLTIEDWVNLAKTFNAQ